MGRGFLYKPYQKPRPEIVGTVVAPHSKGVIAMGERDFHPLSANFLLTQWLPTHWANYCEGKRKAGIEADRADWRIARTIFVADDDKVARGHGRDAANSRYRHYWRTLVYKLMKAKRQIAFKTDASQPDSDLTEEYILDKLVIHGTVSKVVDEILKLREETGDFGEIVYAGMDWVDPRLARRSMELMATEVMPRINKAIGTAESRVHATVGG